MLARDKLGFWHNLNQKKIEKFRNKDLLTNVEQNTFLKNLHKIGYNDVKGYKFLKKHQVSYTCFSKTI